jgi:hypothetical protein
MEHEKTKLAADSVQQAADSQYGFTISKSAIRNPQSAILPFALCLLDSDFCLLSPLSLLFNLPPKICSPKPLELAKLREYKLG